MTLHLTDPSVLRFRVDVGGRTAGYLARSTDEDEPGGWVLCDEHGRWLGGLTFFDTAFKRVLTRPT